MKLLQSISGHRRILLQALRCRHCSSPAEIYEKRNYARNVSEYNTVIDSLTAQRRFFLLRDVYEDMMLDGVQPSRDSFHSFIVGSMKGARLQDAFFFSDEMKAMGLLPDAALYNYLISVCGKCKLSDYAIKIFEEMKKSEVKPTGQTYICLLNACAAAGRVDRVYAIVRDMTAAGLGLNKFCYAGLIAAHKNKTPMPDDTASKIVELVEQSKGWSSVEESSGNAENVMMGVSEEELYNIPTAEFLHRRGPFVMKQLTVYHVAFNACADLRNVQAMEVLVEMLHKDGRSPDVYIIMQMIRCYLLSGDIDKGVQTFENYKSSGRTMPIELYMVVIEGAMLGYTARGMQLAQDTLVEMNTRSFFLTPKMGSDLLLLAAGEETGGYTTANFIWDLMQAKNHIPTFPAVDAYYKGLQRREIPADDPRLLHVERTRESLRARNGPAFGGGRPNYRRSQEVAP